MRINQERHAIEEEIYADIERKRLRIKQCPRLHYADMPIKDKRELLHVVVTTCIVEMQGKSVRK